jgi:hypothetical protein
MSVTDTKIPVSTDTRRELRLIKAHEDVHTYEDAIGLALDAYRSDGRIKGER